MSIEALEQPAATATVSWSSAVADLGAALSRLEALGDQATAGLGRRVRDLDALLARVEALRLQVIGAAEQRRVHEASGHVDTAAWVARQTRVDPGTAARDVRLASGLRTTPATSRALGTGAIGVEHARVIARALEALPAGLPVDQRAVVEVDLVDRARSLTPNQLRRAARRAIAVVEPDEEVVDVEQDRLLRAEEDAALARVSLTMHDHGDGTTSGRFVVPTLHAAMLRSVIHAMTGPRRARPGTRAAQAGATSPHVEEAAHRRGQALCELIEHLPTDHLATTVNATLLVTLDHADLAGRVRAARLDASEDLSAGQARRLACGAGILPAVLGGASQLLDLGRRSRLFTDVQRAALALRHSTCAAEGCERPFAWSEIHHRRAWGAGGRTDLDNAVPLCWFHHRRVHDPEYEHAEHPDGTLSFQRRSGAQ